MYFRLQVMPESKRSSVLRTAGGGFKVAVKEKAVNNLANRRAIEALAEHLKVDPQALRIVSGHRSPHKIVHLTS